MKRKERISIMSEVGLQINRFYDGGDYKHLYVGKSARDLSGAKPESANFAVV